MVTHSELILIGQLIVSVLTLFVHIYNNKRSKRHKFSHLTVTSL